MYTLDKSGATKVTHEMGSIIALRFDSDSTLEVGAVVTLLANGKIKEADAATELPLGYVTVKNTKYDEGGYTVHTNFAAVVTMVANGAVTTGNEVSVTDFDTTNEVSQGTVSTSGDFVSGVALETVTDTETFKVGILRGTYKK